MHISLTRCILKKTKNNLFRIFLVICRSVGSSCDYLPAALNPEPDRPKILNFIRQDGHNLRHWQLVQFMITLLWQLAVEAQEAEANPR